MKNVYGYTRVSTVKQGTGVSLQEQKEAIIKYAEKHNLTICQWFEELETAAKQGRPLFSEMMRLLQRGKANGVIMHKIDRSARNLKDWAVLGDLIDKGVDVHFAHESLDMETRGGRLAADIQAVIASDYIRNLRDETKKGLYGRLKQGIYPFGAPIGYINNGGGKLKTIDPIQGPLVRKAFQLYATGKYNLRTLTKAIKDLGLKNTVAGNLSFTTLAKILNNSFYTGVLKVKGKTFQGAHEPLVSSALFTRVQDILNGKINSKIIKHEFLFRRLIKCNECGYSLIGERQKGNIYYRCHSKECSTKSIREEKLEKHVLECFAKIQLEDIESSTIDALLQEAKITWSCDEQKVEESLKLQQAKISNKLGRLTDAYIEDAIDKNQFEEKKEMLLVDLQGLNHKITDISTRKASIFREVEKFLELIKSLKNMYISAIGEEKRKIIQLVTSNLLLQAKKLIITVCSPFYEIANRVNFASSTHDRTTPRTCTPESDNSNTYSHPDEVRERMQTLLNTIMQYYELHPSDDL